VQFAAVFAWLWGVRIFRGCVNAIRMNVLNGLNGKKQLKVQENAYIEK
jgi:hypothetical protein